MISLTKIDGSLIIINADEIESIETAFDTTISLRSGRKIIVKENYQNIIDAVIEYKKKCFERIFIPDILQKGK